MKKLLLVILLLGGGLGAYYVINGQLPWSTLSEDERQIAQLRETVNAAFRQYQTAGHAAGMSGVDTTGLASDCMDKVEKAEKELEALRPRLKTAGAREAADKLTAEIADVKRRMR